MLPVEDPQFDNVPLPSQFKSAPSNVATVWLNLEHICVLIIYEKLN